MIAVLVKAPGQMPELDEIKGLGDLVALFEGPVDGFFPILGEVGIAYSTKHPGAVNLELHEEENAISVCGPCVVLRRRGFEPLSLYNAEAPFDADEGAWIIHYAQGYLMGATIRERKEE